MGEEPIDASSNPYGHPSIPLTYTIAKTTVPHVLNRPFFMTTSLTNTWPSDLL